MSSILKFPERIFDIWDYSVTHSMLLLRSNLTTVADVRIDVLFAQVEWVDLPSRMNGLIVDVADPAAVRAFKRTTQHRLPEFIQLFNVSGADFSGHVLAASLEVNEDPGPYHTPDIWGVYQGF